MAFRYLALCVVLGLASASFAENPFTRPTLGISGGLNLVEFSGFSGNFAINADFPMLGNANDDGGFTFSVGPRYTVSFANYTLSGNSLSIGSGATISNNLALSMKLLWSFKAGSGYIGPYVDFRPAFELIFLGGSARGLWFGLGGSAAGGLQHFFSSNVGWNLEIEAGVAMPFPIVYAWGAARVGLVFAF